LISGDNYPHIGLNDFVSFCRDVDILDGSIPTSTVDRMFLASKVGAPAGTGNTLYRYEFLEVMIRISNAKFKDNPDREDRVDTFAEALEMMLDTVLEKYELKPWQAFRDQELWNNEIDAVLKVNLDHL